MDPVSAVSGAGGELVATGHGREKLEGKDIDEWPGDWPLDNPWSRGFLVCRQKSDFICAALFTAVSARLSGDRI